MELNFYDYLYHGYTGEYQLISALYRHGLDAVRPPADMGIDVVSLNLKAQLENPSTPSETFFFQVKTAVTSLQVDETGRSSAIAEFKLKDAEVETLCQGVGRALVCYVYTRENDALTNSYEAPFCCFWIDGDRLSTLRDNNSLFLRAGDSKRTLRCRLTLPPTEGGHWYACIVDEADKIVDEGYLGAIDSQNEATQASDGADHYSIKGYLDHARGQNESNDAANEKDFGVETFTYVVRVDGLAQIAQEGIKDEEGAVLSVEVPDRESLQWLRAHSPEGTWCVLLLDGPGVIQTCKIQDCPTQPQTQVRIDRDIPPNLIKAAVFENYETWRDYKDLFSYGTPSYTADRCKINYFE